MPLDEKGWEVLDPTPIARPLRFSRPPTQLEEIRRMMAMVSREAEQQGHETFEEADDFDVGDDYDPQSPWELSIDQELASLSGPSEPGPGGRLDDRGSQSADPPVAEAGSGKGGAQPPSPEPPKAS